VRHGSDIDLHVFSDSLEAVRFALDAEGLVYDVEKKRVRKHGEERIFTHIHVRDRFPFELTVYATEYERYVFKSSITAQGDGAGQQSRELEQFCSTSTRTCSWEEALQPRPSRSTGSRSTKRCCCHWKTSSRVPSTIPKATCCTTACRCSTWPATSVAVRRGFLAGRPAARRWGKGLDSENHTAAALEALDGFITERTAWLIEHHMEAQLVLDGTIGARGAGGGCSRTRVTRELISLARW